MVDRGKQYNKLAATQPKDYSGLRFGNITPTDIDGFMDFGNKLFIIFELKFGDAKLPYGQELALRRLCDALLRKDDKISERPTIECWLLVATHNAGYGQDIDAAKAIVTQWRTQETVYTRWNETKHGYSLRLFIEKIKAAHEGGTIKALIRHLKEKSD